MFAYEIPGLRFSLPAGGTVARCRFVSASAGKGVQATAATPVIGASMNEVTEATDRIVEIADGIVMVEAAAEITGGTKVYSNADGKAVAEGTEVAGIAITSGAAGQLIAVKV